MGYRQGATRVGQALGLAAVLAFAAAGSNAAGWWWNTAEKAGGAGPITLRVTYSNKVDYEPLMVAVDKGFFRAEGLNVKPLLVSGGIESAEALATGAADVAAMGDAPAVISVCKYPQNKIVCAYGGGSQRHRLIASAQLKTPKDLEGKKLGLQLGSSTHGCFLAWATANGLDVSRVEILNLKPAEIPLAMSTGQLDAMAGSEPWATHTEKQCGARVHELAHFGGHMGTSPMVVLASRRTLEARPEALAKLVRALCAAVAWVNANHARTAAICAPLTGLSLADQETCAYKHTWRVRWEREDTDSLALTARFLQEYGKITALPDLMQAVETRYLQEAR
jgi:NitT/TauT family transport system substrate-binding protein